MDDTDFSALAPTDTISGTDGIVIVRGAVPYRFTGQLPTINGNSLQFFDSPTTYQAATQIQVGEGTRNPSYRMSFGYWLNAGVWTGVIDAVQNALPASLCLNPSGGVLLVGTTSGPCHILQKAGAETTSILVIRDDPSRYTANFTAATGAGYSFASSAVYFGKNSTTNRSINAGGTVNASGADYAEYLRKALAYVEWQFAKGEVLGINDAGELTPRWSEAHSFVIKSYDPSYVGGDTWSQHLGPRPVAPIAPEAWNGGSIPEREADEAEAAYARRRAAWYASAKEFAAAQIAFNADLPVWEAALEEARAVVDRIAFSGQVPVIVEGDYAPGQYLVAHEGPDDTIVCRAHALAELLADPALAYRKVGKVWAVREVKLNPADDSEAPELVTRAWANVLHS